MTIPIKTAEDVQGMRLAGRLASEVLDLLGPLVQPGVTTGELDRIAHDHMVNVQGGVPATLGYGPPGYPPFPASLCTSINEQVCHGIPDSRVLKNGDIVNIDVTVIKDGWHGDNSRMYIVGEGSIAAKRLCAWAISATRSRPSPRTKASASCASSAATASAASSTRSLRCSTTAGRARSRNWCRA
jgi:methionyl aminopeptidase